MSNYVVLYLLIGVSITFIIIYVYIISKREQEIIKKGKKYKKIQELNSEYEVDNLIYDYEIQHYVKSKRSLEKFDIRTFAMQNIKENYKNIKQALFNVKEWIIVYSEYLDEFDKICRKKPHYNKKEKINLKYFKDFNDFKMLEDEMVNRCKINKKYGLTLTVKVDYISPKGKSHWIKKEVYSYRDIIELIEESNNIDNRKAFAQYQRSLITVKVRTKILKRDNYTCQLCGRKAKDGYQMEVDHIIPVSKGGTSDESNLQTLCWDCNRGKSNDYDDIEDTGYYCSNCGETVNEWDDFCQNCLSDSNPLFEEVKEQLINEGIEKGYVTFDQIAYALKGMEIDEEQLEELYNELVGADINVVTIDEKVKEENEEE